MARLSARFSMSFPIAGLAAACALWAADPHDGVAAEVSAGVGATIYASGSVGPVEPEPEPVVEAAPAPVAEPTVTTATTIRAVPVSTTSNVGFGDIASAADQADANEAAAVEAAADAESETAPTPAAAVARASSRARPLSSLGPSTSVGVAGAPNQTYSIILPQSAAFSSGGRVVNLSGFVHTAGPTPSVNRAGRGRFDVGAEISAAPILDGGAGQASSGPVGGDDQQAQVQGGTDGVDGRKPTVLAEAFAARAPYVSIVVSYN
jgi:hypothetical protein